MADGPGRKADLDKDGIEFADSGKAELDKEGISLDADEAPKQDLDSGPATVSQTVRKTPGRKRILLMAGAGAVGILVLLTALGYFFLHGQPEQPRVAQKEIPRKESPFGQDGLVLDPFMVFYKAATPKKSGVLVAQVSLKVDPNMIDSIQSRLFDIRSIIYRRLLSAANVYSQTEITLMLSDDLMDYPIQEVAFVQYSAK